MNYYIIIDGKQQGPLSIEDVFSYPVTLNTKIWHDGLPGWIDLKDSPELFARYNASPQTPPPYSSYNTSYTQPQYAPGNMPPTPGYYPKPESYLVWAILVTILCCLPLGIAAIINSCQVDNAYNAGNYQEAERKSKLTRNLVIWSVCISAVIYILYILAYIIGFAALMNFS